MKFFIKFHTSYLLFMIKIILIKNRGGEGGKNNEIQDEENFEGLRFERLRRRKKVKWRLLKLEISPG